MSHLSHEQWENPGQQQGNARELPSPIHPAAHSLETSFFLAFTQSYLMNWHAFSCTFLFFNLFLHISIKPTEIFWSCIMFYLHYIVSAHLMSNLFIFIKEQSPSPPHCPRCINENQKISEGWETKSVQEFFHVYIVSSSFSKSKLRLLIINWAFRNYYLFLRLSQPQ